MILLEWEVERGWFLSSSKNGQNKTIKKDHLLRNWDDLDVSRNSWKIGDPKNPAPRRKSFGFANLSSRQDLDWTEISSKRCERGEEASHVKQKESRYKKQSSSQMNLFFAFLQHWKTVWAHKRVRKLGFEKWKAESEQSTKKFIKKKKSFQLFSD